MKFALPRIWQFKLINHCVCIFLFSFNMNLSHAENYDLHFLKEAPFKKAKQLVDISEVKNEEELEIVRESITSILQLFIILHQINPPENTISRVTTENGKSALILPPLDTKTRRYSLRKIKISVLDTTSIEAEASFFSTGKSYSTYESKFIFIKENDGWRFDHHAK